MVKGTSAITQSFHNTRAAHINETTGCVITHFLNHFRPALTNEASDDAWSAHLNLCFKNERSPGFGVA